MEALESGEGKQRKTDLSRKIQDLDPISNEGATYGEGGIRSRRWYIWEKGN